MFHHKSFSSEIVARLEQIKAENSTTNPATSDRIEIRPSTAAETPTLNRGWVLMEEGFEEIQSFLPPPASRSVPSASPSCGRSLELYALLSQEMIDIPRLRQLAWHGVPMGIRGTVWKLLLSYLPANRLNHEYIFTHRRNLYRELVRKHYKDHSHHTRCCNTLDIEQQSPSTPPLQHLEFESMESFPLCSCFNTDDRMTLNQIHLDVPRTAPRGLNKGLYRSPAVHNLLVRLLYVWAKENPEVGYVQGLNDLPIPFVIVFLSEYLDQPIEDVLGLDDLSEAILTEVEADAYWCLSLMMAEMQPFFVRFTEGMTRLIDRMSELVKLRDESLYAHLTQQGCDLMVVSLRWMICLLTREFSYDLNLRLWDSYLSHGQGWVDFHVYVCAAFITTPAWTATLKDLEFSELVVFLQQAPTHEWSDADIEGLMSGALDIWLKENGKTPMPEIDQPAEMEILRIEDEEMVEQEEPILRPLVSNSTTIISPQARSQSNEDLEFFRYLTQPIPPSSEMIDRLIEQGFAQALLTSSAGRLALRGSC